MDISQEISDTSHAKKAFPALRRETLVVTAVLAILAVALGLRLFGLNWDEGFAWTPHPDERAILARVDTISPPPIGDLGVLLDADESPWNPRWFPYGSFPLYLLKGAQLVASVGPGDEVSDLRLIGRAISALADVVTVLMVFVLGSRVYGRRVGLLASALAALAVIHIQLSHFFAVDTLLALFTIVSFYFMYRVAREGRPRDSILAGVFIGLGLATKVSQGPIFGAFVIAHLMYAFAVLRDASSIPQSFSQRWSTAIKGASVGIGVSVAIFFVAQPYAFLDWSRFLGDVTEQSEMVHRIRDYPYTRQYIDTTPYLYQARQLATWGLGWPLGIVAWAGLLYASLRGMRLKYGLAYLGVGWILPAAILLYSASFFAIFAASGVALLALLGTLPVRSQDSRADVLLLSWVVPYFLITGALQVKFMRYLIPITPFLLLFGSRMLFALWDRFGVLRPRIRPWMAAGLAMLVGVTGFYAISYAGIYSETHTAVRASDWINLNAPKGSVILKEHWEEGLPNMSGYDVRELPLYNDDTEQKSRLIASELAEADYLVFFSNRLYGTIPRLPERYPFSREYYSLLFSGQLGYELVDFEATYPEFLGVGFVDDTFERPDVPEPITLQGFQPSPVTLNLGFADESFSVYDHPKVLIFENAEHLSASFIRRVFRETVTFDGTTALFDGSAASSGSLPQTTSAQSVGLMLSPQDAEAQQQGGTWSDIIRPDSWTNRFPVLAWLVVVEGISLLALPLTFLIFKPLPDRGYLFSKALGLLIVSLIVWLLASVQWMAFSRGSINLALVLLALASAVAIARRRRELAAFVRERWSLLLIGEIVFLVAFFAFLLIRMANPDLWHPFRGGEKPMDMAYLNAVLRSSYMPPFDPWFGGGYINYYYWGQFIVATLIRATGIEPSIAFNLAVPLLFALTVAGAFALVYNLAESTRRASIQPKGRWLNQGLRWSPVLAGLGGALFVTVLGNLDGALQVGQGVWRAMFQNAPFGEFDFWRSSRMMAPDPPGHEITEFPFFTFLFADLHAHMMVIPFTLLSLGLSLSLVLGAARRAVTSAHWGKGEIARVVVLGVVIGALRLINTWDFPTYLIIGVASVFLAEFLAQGGLGTAMLVRAGLKSVLVFAAGYLVFLPFHLTYETFVGSIESTTNTTMLWQFLAISGLFIFIIGSFFVSESRDLLARALRGLWRGSAWTVQAVSRDDDDASDEGSPIRMNVWGVLALVAGALLIGVIMTAIFSGVVGSTIPFVALLLALVLIVALRWLSSARADSPPLAFVALIVSVSLALAIGVDIFRVEGDIDRMNTIFKFYLQIWVMLALASAYLLWRLGQGKRVPLRKLALGKKAWVGALAVLVVSASVYPALGTKDRLRDRFYDQILPLTLDGTAYAENVIYSDQKGDIDLGVDFEGIRWLQDNVEGSPIVLEGLTPTYRWGSRVSIYTGLPSVVGWQWHQQQQRGDYAWAVDRRIEDVNKIYSTTDSTTAMRLIRKYNVKYVYVGQLERLYYPSVGLLKFDSSLSDALEEVFKNDEVTIYRVRDEASFEISQDVGRFAPE